MCVLEMRASIANAIGYQMVWLVSVGAAARGDGLTGPLAALVFVLVVLHFGNKQRQDLALIAIALILGLLTDSLWIGLGWMHYRAGWNASGVAPLWILGVWAAFAATLNHSLAALKKRLLLGALLGAIGGPLAYWAASRELGAVDITAPAPVVLAGLGIAWTICIPLLLWAANTRVPPSIPREALH